MKFSVLALGAVLMTFAVPCVALSAVVTVEYSNVIPFWSTADVFGSENYTAFFELDLNSHGETTFHTGGSQTAYADALISAGVTYSNGVSFVFSPSEISSSLVTVTDKAVGNADLFSVKLSGETVSPFTPASIPPLFGDEQIGEPELVGTFMLFHWRDDSFAPPHVPGTSFTSSDISELAETATTLASAQLVVDSFDRHKREHPFSPGVIQTLGNNSYGEVGFCTGYSRSVAQVVPEPSTLIIWSLLGALGITGGWWHRRKR